MEPEVTEKVAKCNKKSRLCCSKWTRGAIYMENLVNIILEDWRRPSQDKMCTHIVDFQDRKIYLRGHEGQLLATVSGKASRERHIAKAARVHGVHFPDPGPAEGVESRTTWRNTCRDHPQTILHSASLRTMIARAWSSD